MKSLFSSFTIILVYLLSFNSYAQFAATTTLYNNTQIIPGNVNSYFTIYGGTNSTTGSYLQLSGSGAGNAGIINFAAGHYTTTRTNVFNFINRDQNGTRYDMTIDNKGNVIIGNPPLNVNSYTNYLLNVGGSIRATSVTTNTDGADFVFEKEYKLRSLNEVEKYINENKHLPDVPSAAEMKENGVKLEELSTTLLQKVEELTLYMIELKKENEELRGLVKNPQK